MAKENTHFIIAENIAREMKNKKLGKILSANKAYYLLGAAAPDAFYYHKNPIVQKISEYLHGRNGGRADEIILKMLDIVRNKVLSGEEVAVDIAFIFGYLSHCAVDFFVHPFVKSLAGDYYDEDKFARKKAKIAHREIETSLELTVFFAPSPIIGKTSAAFIQKTVFSQIISKKIETPPLEVQKAFSRQIFFNILFQNKFVGKLTKILSAVEIVSKENAALFYGAIGRKLEPEEIEKFKELCEQAKEKTKETAKAAFQYCHGEISKKDLIPCLSFGDIS